LNQNGDAFNRDIYGGAPLGPRRLDQAGWSYFVDMLHRMARRARETHGLMLVFHPHCDATIEAEPEIERLLALTDPGLVGFCMDTGHHAYGGGDPVAFWRKYPSRGDVGRLRLRPSGFRRRRGRQRRSRCPAPI